MNGTIEWTTPMERFQTLKNDSMSYVIVETDKPITMRRILLIMNDECSCKKHITAIKPHINENTTGIIDDSGKHKCFYVLACTSCVEFSISECNPLDTNYGTLTFTRRSES
jgi:hypothetical protein